VPSTAHALRRHPGSLAWTSPCRGVQRPASGMTLRIIEELLEEHDMTLRKPPLDGIRVLDLTRVLAGPWCTQNLADLGAEVSTIEGRGKGDDARGWGPPCLKKKDGTSSAEAAYYLSTNRNKKAVCVDISTGEGAEFVRMLARGCDVLVENFKAGGLAKYGLDYGALKADNPRLVYCSITGFGHTGPYAGKMGYDLIIQGMGGLMSITGEKDEMPGGG